MTGVVWVDYSVVPVDGVAMVARDEDPGRRFPVIPGEGSGKFPVT